MTRRLAWPLGIAAGVLLLPAFELWLRAAAWALGW